MILNLTELTIIENQAIEKIIWPVHSSLEKKVLAIQTTRANPFESSTTLECKNSYSAFNLGVHVGDNLEEVKKNRNDLQKLLPSTSSIQWLDQTHSNKVVNVNHVCEQPLVADAIITSKKNIALAIMTADCLPILLTNKQGSEIAAIHGGWRPLAANIIANTLFAMESVSKELYAWLGPCIGASSFEVGQEVVTAFTEQNSALFNAFTKQANGKYLANLQYIAQLQLQQLGIANIISLPECTYGLSSKYYSYRRQQVTGRMATLICRL